MFLKSLVNFSGFLQWD